MLRRFAFAPSSLFPHSPSPLRLRSQTRPGSPPLPATGLPLSTTWAAAFIPVSTSSNGAKNLPVNSMATRSKARSMAVGSTLSPKTTTAAPSR